MTSKGGKTSGLLSSITKLTITNPEEKIPLLSKSDTKKKGAVNDTDKIKREKIIKEQMDRYSKFDL